MPEFPPPLKPITVGFYQDNVAANQAAVALTIQGDATRTENPMPLAGSVIGIVVYSNEARAAGTLTVDVTINGAVTGLQGVLDAVHTQTHGNTQSPGINTFAKWDRIGVKITTDAGWLPVTADITVEVTVEVT